MEWVAAMFADAANTSAEGKLNMLGIFTELLTQSAPCQMTAAFVVMMRADPFDQGRLHEVTVDVVDADGNSIHKMPAMTVNVPEQSGVISGPTQLILNLQGFPFPNFGDYRFEVTVNGHHMGGATIRVGPFAAEQGPMSR